MEREKVCVVVGVGPGTGESLVRRFAEGGYRVAALARSEDELQELIAPIEGATAHACDVTDAVQVARVFEHIAEEFGRVHTMMYNAGSGTFGTFDEVTPEDLRSSWEVNTLGLFLTAKQVMGGMASQGDGVIGITGATASTRGKPFTTAFAQAKMAQRGLAQSIAREFGPEGVHVFYYVVDGVIDLPRTRERMPDKPDETFLNPDHIAQVAWDVAHQPRSAWTFELDIRPHVEEW